MQFVEPLTASGVASGPTHNEGKRTDERRSASQRDHHLQRTVPFPCIYGHPPPEIKAALGYRAIQTDCIQLKRRDSAWHATYSRTMRFAQCARLARQRKGVPCPMIFSNECAESHTVGQQMKASSSSTGI